MIVPRSVGAVLQLNRVVVESGLLIVETMLPYSSNLRGSRDFGLHLHRAGSRAVTTRIDSTDFDGRGNRAATERRSYRP